MFSKSQKFGTAICCIRGGIHAPILDWFKHKYGIINTDLITEPGVDRFANHGDMDLVDLRRKIQLSITHHDSKIILVLSHHACIAFTTSDEAHKIHTKKLAERIRHWFPSSDITIQSGFIDERNKLVILN